jgi:type 1 glutamine amidotransferase
MMPAQVGPPPNGWPGWRTQNTMNTSTHSLGLTLASLLTGGCLLLSGCTAVSQSTQPPKRVLVVTTTTGFRHSSIPTAEKVLGELARTSGAFTVDYARVEPTEPQFKGADGKPDKAKVEAAIAAVLGEKMSPQALLHYDAVVFANSTGDLPIPDKEAFLDWIKSGRGFVGMHSASDTFHGYPPFIEMLGGEFKSHGAQVEVDAINQDPQCPACRPLPGSWKVFDEIYLFKNFDRSKVHGLLTLDKHPNEKTPGDYPIAWCKQYGKGRVFYTSLGHREDIWDPNWTDSKGQRKNPAEVSRQYQQHILGGIKWALGLEPGDARPQSPQ